MSEIVRSTFSRRCSAVIKDAEGLDCSFISGESVESLRACYARMQRDGGFYAYDREFVIYEGDVEVERIPIDSSAD